MATAVATPGFFKNFITANGWNRGAKAYENRNPANTDYELMGCFFVVLHGGRRGARRGRRLKRGPTRVGAWCRRQSALRFCFARRTRLLSQRRVLQRHDA